MASSARRLDELFADAVLDEQAAAGRAALAAVEINGVKRAGDRLVEIGVGEDHVGALAPQLKRAPLERVGRFAGNDFRRLDVAREGELIDPRMHDHCLAGRLAHAVENVDHAFGNPGFE